MRQIIATVFAFLASMSPACMAETSLSSATLKYGMVVSADKTASEAGMKILRQGGNAIDAAVAVGYALAVTFPCCGNIGGGGFMTIHLADGKNIFINFREKAPLNASPDMFNNLERTSHATDSFLAVATPGTVMGFETALKQYGTMSTKQVIQPAIHLAENGYIVTPRDALLFKKYADDFAKQPNVAAIFLKDGRTYNAGERLIQPDLAKTLKQIATGGSKAFYQGDIAQKIATASKQHQGLLSLKDFKEYTAQELNPIQCHYRGFTVISAPPPSSGGVTLCEALNILENFPLAHLAHGSAISTKLILEAMRQSFIDRNMKLGDPDFINNPTQQLISKAYAKEIAQKILRHPSAIHEKLNSSRELKQTTHYSVLDRNGNAVSVTYTLNGFFGSRLIASNTGFFLNNEMDDFATQVGKANKFGLIQNEANAIAAGKRPLSSMTPSILLKNGKVYLITGSPGGPRIITAVLLTLINHIDYGFPIDQASNLPRFHFQHQPNVVFTEPGALSFLTRKQLELSGYAMERSPTWGAVESILIDPKNGEVTGANDIRRPDGAAIGE